MSRNVGILIFNDVEVLDFAGPFEVFSVASELNNSKLFNVFTVAKSLTPVTTVNGLSVNPNYDFNNTPPLDILIIPGGFGTRQLLKDTKTLAWIQESIQNTELTITICTGSSVLGKLGILDNQPYCTHYSMYGFMEELVPTGFPQKSKRFIGFDKFYTSGGISAGIDVSFHCVEMLYGKDIAQQTAAYMEYKA